MKVLVLATHPDDETLGCGGTLLKHKAQDDQVHWLIITKLIEEKGFSKEVIVSREEEVKKVTEMYDFDGVHQLELPTTTLDSYSTGELVDLVSKVFIEVKPEVVYFPFSHDVHSDHRIIFDAAFSCTKSFRYPFIKKILMMETLSETEFAPSLGANTFVPNYFVDVSDYLDKKIEILNVYKSEMKKHPFPRSIENIKALATYRGASSGCRYAESFMLLKEIT